MKIVKPKPFTFEAGPRAVLLLHGFTGHTADVRMLGRFLQKKGYTSHAPIYRGHGQPPEALLDVTPEEWWSDVLEAYHHLQDLGYTEIAVAGLSLGGVLTLKLASNEPLKGIIPMCAPVFFDSETQLTQGFHKFAKEYKELEGKDKATIQTEVEDLMKRAEPMFERLGNAINEASEIIDMIYTKAFVVQAREDEMINTKSATYIYENLESDEKDIKWYEDSTHVITLSKQRDELHEDIFEFLESLDWTV